MTGVPLGFVHVPELVKNLPVNLRRTWSGCCNLRRP